MFREEDLVFINWRSYRHCVRNEWPFEWINFFVSHVQYPRYFGQSVWNRAALTKLIAQQCIWQYQMSRDTFKVFSTCIRGRSQIMFTGIFPLRWHFLPYEHWQKTRHFWTTYPTPLVNVVCECPLMKCIFFLKSYLLGQAPRLDLKNYIWPADL